MNRYNFKIEKCLEYNPLSKSNVNLADERVFETYF